MLKRINRAEEKLKSCIRLKRNEIRRFFVVITNVELDGRHLHNCSSLCFKVCLNVLLWGVAKFLVTLCIASFSAVTLHLVNICKRSPPRS